jgi:hypothetical protein
LFQNPTKHGQIKLNKWPLNLCLLWLTITKLAHPLTQSTLGHHASFSIEAIEVNLLGANFVELENQQFLLTKV